MLQRNIKVKITERRFPIIMVEYAENSATGTYLMYNPATKRLVLTCDVNWHVFDVESTANDPTFLNLLKVQNRKQPLGIIQEMKKKMIIN